MALLLERLDQSKFLLWKNASVDGEIVWPDGVGNLAGRTYRSGEPDLARDGRRGGGASAERFNESAISRGSSQVNTPRSRSSA
jgi:hypothetical protein